MIVEVVYSTIDVIRLYLYAQSPIMGPKMLHAKCTPSHPCSPKRLGNTIRPTENAHDLSTTTYAPLFSS